MLKINWGTGIAIFYCIFAITLVSAVVKSTTFDNSLVVDNYYEQDLKYQQHLDHVNNTKVLPQTMDVHVNESLATVRLAFPKNLFKSSGTVHFFSPISNKEDVEFDLKLDQHGVMQVPVHALRSGRWKIKTSWTCDQQSYYDETEIIL